MIMRLRQTIPWSNKRLKRNAFFLRQNRNVSDWNRKEYYERKKKRESRWRWNAGRYNNNNRRNRSAVKLRSICVEWLRKRPKERLRRNKSKKDKRKSIERDK